MKPLFKKGDRAEFSNYRPISLLTSFSKIIEKCIYKTLYCYLNDNKILIKEQFVFSEKLSTNMATYALLNNVLSSLSKRKSWWWFILRLTQCVLCINQNTHLVKMKFYCISVIANKFMRSYEENIYQRISMKDSNLNKLFSEWVHVKHGVPQGSVLGQLLFLIYINDLPLNISKLVNSILFADDMSIVILNTKPEECKTNINSVMAEIINWFQSNFLTLNCDKTYFLQFVTKKQNEIKIQIIASNPIITIIKNIKCLGLIIDSTLSWRDHVVGLTSTLNKTCYAIRAIKHFMPSDVLRKIYFSYYTHLRHTVFLG